MVIPVVEMRVTRIVPGALSAAVEIETTVLPKRDTGETFKKNVDVGCRDETSPSSGLLQIYCVGAAMDDGLTGLAPGILRNG